jgi:hypothetical protein
MSTPANRQPPPIGYSTPARSVGIRALPAAVAASGLAMLGAFAWWWTHPGDPTRELRTRHRPLVTLERAHAPELGPGLERWSMIAADSDTVTGLWRAGAQANPSWVVVLLGGIGTDDRSALLVPDTLPIGVLAVSWPWKGPRQMNPHEFLLRVPAIRGALLETPAAIARGVEAARRACPDSRVALIGASLGVPPTVAALPLANVDALVLVDGAADLRRLLRSEVGTELGRGMAARALAPIAASLGARLLSPLEPAHHGSFARALPVLFVDAEEEERYPPECVTRLHATFPHAAHARHPGKHIRPEDKSQVAAVIVAVATWLDTLTVAALPSGVGLR